MSSKESEIYELIEPLCQNDNIYLLEVSVSPGGKNALVKIIVDTDEGVTLNQCQGLSKNISDIFYRRDMFKGAYRLEVSSPGTNKPLEHPYEFKRNIGKQLKVNYLKGDEVCSTVGDLIDHKQDVITLGADGSEIIIPIEDIEEAKIKLKW